jgi:hypothetical protein
VHLHLHGGAAVPRNRGSTWLQLHLLLIHEAVPVLLGLLNNLELPGEDAG